MLGRTDVKNKKLSSCKAGGGEGQFTFALTSERKFEKQVSGF